MIKASSFGCLTDQADSRCWSGNLRLSLTDESAQTSKTLPMIPAPFPAPLQPFVTNTGPIPLIGACELNAMQSVQQSVRCS